VSRLNVLPVNRRTVRVRLTALYSALFLATSTTLVIVVNLLLRQMLERRVTVINKGQLPPVRVPGGDPGSPPTPVPIEIQHQLSAAASDLRDDVLRFQWGVTAVTIVVLTLVSIAAGWWLAGRVLRPLHQITSTARRLSLSNLHERIALAGPADELKELADTFDDMLARLERSAESQRQFVANASHELRTPLAIQRAAIQIGLDDPSPERLTQVRAELLDANRRSERLIDGLLTLAQGDHGLDTRELVRLDEVAERAASEIPAGDVTVRVDARTAAVSGDPVLLHRLVSNLVHNAVRYNHPGGTVDVRVSAPGLPGPATLVVTNTGPEVPQERVGELFEPFRRLHTRTRSDGSGLGLSIVASIARAHGARVTARPNPGGGLELTITFPRYDG